MHNATWKSVTESYFFLTQKKYFPVELSPSILHAIGFIDVSIYFLTNIFDCYTRTMSLI